MNSVFIRLKWEDVLELRIIPTAVTVPDGIKPLERLATLHRPKVLRCKICLEWEAKVWRKLREDIWLSSLEYKAQMFGTM
jgi:hypothetical protein